MNGVYIIDNVLCKQGYVVFLPVLVLPMIVLFVYLGKICIICLCVLATFVIVSSE